MESKEVINLASDHLSNISGHIFDVLTITKPISPEAAVNLTKIISKLSPILGNLIEFNTVELLNSQEDFKPYGRWVRQDPGFPDAIFQGNIYPLPGFEIKAWFPMATEITARFKDSQNHFIQDNIYVAILAWLPEHLIFGKPQIIDVCIVSGLSIAQSRDLHYHKPPDYIVLEPEDTTARTQNLQQTNTNGLKFQGTASEFEEAKKFLETWGQDSGVYRTSADYQSFLRELTSRYKYRLDTNFAKLDRIEHNAIEQFKSRVYNTNIHGMTIRQWSKLFSTEDSLRISYSLNEHLGITREDVDELLL